MSIKVIQYDKISKLSSEDLNGISKLNVVFDDTDPDTVMAIVNVQFDEKNNCYVFERSETYDSLKEFSTVVMKELLTLYSKRQIIASDPIYFKKDDPRLHSFLSKLSYPGIQSVCENMEEFADQFKTGHVSMKLPKGNVGGSTRIYKNQPLHK
jgi:hypothetical protein